ncbi:hypothetical protein O181_119183 [Austropuccinia psidii MF-1]|uniref:Uncharacterized protein n=1 Tax=Austropuccinia psidii MF-1 TaxID=1389203 RepID=A0A9Q3PZ44_9BASI|nr:hypothetical protein [Austropuccinia psidii MF-1]
MRPKGDKGGSQLAPKARWGPAEPLFVTNSLGPKLAKKPMSPVGPFFGHGPISQPWPRETTKGHQISSVTPPQHMGNSFHSFIPSILEVAGMVHIWYFIPLCTIFAQQSNEDVFRTHLHLSISSSQNPTPILKGDYSTHQSEKLWQQSEDSSRIPTTCICRSWLVQYSGLFKRGNYQEVLHQFSQLSRHQVFQYSLENSIHPYRPHSVNLYGLGTIGPFHIPLCELNHTVNF